MEAVILIVALIFVTCVVLGAYVTVKAIGAAKRGVDRTVTEARRSVEDAALRARSVGRPGAHGELARLRLRLRSSMRATQEVLRAGNPADASLSESVRLFERLSAHGRELEEHLGQAEREPDRARVATNLRDLRDRTEQIIQSADALRWAVGERAERSARDDLSALRADIDLESSALRHWAPVHEPERAPAADRDPEGSAQEGSAHEGAGSSGKREREAPGPSDPKRFERGNPWAGRPWRKDTKPETTS